METDNNKWYEQVGDYLESVKQERSKGNPLIALKYANKAYQIVFEHSINQKQELQHTGRLIRFCYKKNINPKIIRILKKSASTIYKHIEEINKCLLRFEKVESALVEECLSE
jgi:hypothetical protein